MSVEYRIDKDYETVYLTLKGEVTAEEIMDILGEVFESEDYQPHFSGISDLRGLHWESNQSDLRKLVQFILKYRGRIGRHRSAIVVSSERAFGMSRMFEVFSEQTPIRVRVFRDYDEALGWARGGPANEEDE